MNTKFDIGTLSKKELKSAILAVIENVGEEKAQKWLVEKIYDCIRNIKHSAIAKTVEESTRNFQRDYSIYMDNIKEAAREIGMSVAGIESDFLELSHDMKLLEDGAHELYINSNYLDGSSKTKRFYFTQINPIPFLNFLISKERELLIKEYDESKNE